jgi:hypothetical protein
MSSDNIISRFTSSFEGLPKLIASSLTKRKDDFRARTQKVIDDIVSDFDLEKTIKEVAEPLLHNALTAAIKDHFESTSGKEAIKSHIENMLKEITPGIRDNDLPDTSTVEDKEDTAQEENTDQVATPVSIKEAVSVAPEGVLFADPLTLTDIETLQDRITPIKFFTLDGFKHSLEYFQNKENPTHPVLVLNREDAAKIALPPFDTFFDPITEAARITQGQIGHILNMEVYSDTATGQSPFITKSGFLDRPVELQHTTATNQTMAEVVPS